MKAGGGEVQGRSKLAGPKRFEQEGHDTGFASPGHERGRGVVSDQDDRAGCGDRQLRSHRNGVAVGQLRGHDGHVGLGSLHEFQSAGTLAALGGRSAAGGEDRVTERGAEAIVVVEDHHTPARSCRLGSGTMSIHASSVEHQARCVKSQICNGRGTTASLSRSPAAAVNEGRRRCV